VGADHRRQPEEIIERSDARSGEANRLKSEFLDKMGHDLRTPLNAIIGFADLMHRGKVGPVSDDHKEYLGDILNSSHELLELLNDILDFAKVESGTMKFSPEPLNLDAVVAEVHDSLRGLATSKRILVETEVDSTVVQVVLDPSRLKQVLHNHLSNAINFTPAEGQVTIRVVGQGLDRFRIEIEDTGIAMTERPAGTGALALIKGIVEAQGGQAGAQSQPGKGSTFWVVLPRCHAVSPPVGTATESVRPVQYGG